MSPIFSRNSSRRRAAFRDIAATLLVASLCSRTTLAFQPSGSGVKACHADAARLGGSTLPTTFSLLTKQPPIHRNGRRTLPFLTSTSAADADDVNNQNNNAPLTPPVVSVQKSLMAASLLIGLDIGFRKLFQVLSIGFPSALGGCGALFATFLLVPGGGPKLYELLSPGAALLAKWLPLFFVPSLITLPLADRLGSLGELMKVALVIVGGFYFTLLTTAWTVVGVRRLLPSKQQGTSDGEGDDAATSKATDAAVVPSSSSPPPKPFSDTLNNRLRVLSVASFVAAVLATKLPLPFLSLFQTPLTSLFMLSITLTSFVFGARLPKPFVKIVHPLITCATLTWATIMVFVKVTGTSFISMLKGYRTKNMGIMTGGAGDLLLFLLGPAVIALACQMYDKRKLMKENIVEVGSAVCVSAFGGVFGTAAAVRFLQIASPYLRLSLLSRNITSPLAMAIAGILGADVSLAVSMVVVTGLIGANFGASILDSFGIKDAVARGLSMGAAAHGLGTAAFVDEKDAFPFAAISMALTASATTVIVSIPLFKRWLLQLALGA